MPNASSTGLKPPLIPKADQLDLQRKLDFHIEGIQLIHGTLKGLLTLSLLQPCTANRQEDLNAQCADMHEAGTVLLPPWPCFFYVLLGIMISHQVKKIFNRPDRIFPTRPTPVVFPRAVPPVGIFCCVT